MDQKIQTILNNSKLIFSNLEKLENDNTILQSDKKYFKNKKEFYNLKLELEEIVNKKEKRSKIKSLIKYGLKIFEKNHDKNLEKYYYIYKIKNNDIGYIFLCEYNLDNLKEIKENIQIHKKLNLEGNSYELVGEYLLSSKIHGEIIVDKLIYEQDLIQKGYHNDYNIVKREFMYKEKEEFEEYINELIEIEKIDRKEYDIEYIPYSIPSITGISNKECYKNIYKMLSTKYKYFTLLFPDVNNLNFIYFSHHLFQNGLKSVNNTLKSKYYRSLAAYFSEIKNFKMAYSYNLLASYCKEKNTKCLTNEDIDNIENINNKNGEKILIDNLPSKYTFTKYYNIYPEILEEKKNIVENCVSSIKDELLTYRKATTFKNNGDQGYIYIIINEKTCRKISQKDYTFKVGKTTNLTQRISAYSDKNVEVLKQLFTIYCNKNLGLIEKEILKEFGVKFEREKKLLGNEYFTGNILEAEKIIIEIVNKYGNFENDIEKDKWMDIDLNKYNKINHEDEIILVEKNSILNKYYENLTDNDKKLKSNSKKKEIEVKEDKIENKKIKVIDNKDKNVSDNKIIDQKKLYKREWYEKNKAKVSEYNKRKYKEIIE